MMSPSTEPSELEVCLFTCMMAHGEWPFYSVARP